MAEPSVFLSSLIAEAPFGYKSGAAQADQFAVLRDNRVKYFGSDGDVEDSFISADSVRRLNGKGAAVEIEGFECGSRILLHRQLGGKLPQLNASVAFTTDQDFEILGTNASNDDVTNDPEGGLILETDTASGDQVILLPHLDANQTPWTSVTWGTDQETRYEAVVKTPATITSMILWIGLKLTNTNVTATDDHQAFFRYEAGVNSGKWQCITSVAGVDTATDSGVTLLASTAYHLVIVIGSDRAPKFYINNATSAGVGASPVTTGPAMTTAIDLIPYVGVQTATAAARSATARACAISRKYA